MNIVKSPLHTFLSTADLIRKQIRNSETLVAEQTASEFAVFIEVRRLAVSSVVASLTVTPCAQNKSDPDLNHQLGILATFVQGMEVSERLVETGQYAKAATVLKQDYESLCRLAEIRSNAAKDGKTPNAKYGPHGSQHIYGHLNSAAHPSNISVLMNNLRSDLSSNGSRTLSPNPVFRKDVIGNTCWLNAWIALEFARAAVMYAFDLHGDVPEIGDALTWYEEVTMYADQTGYFKIMEKMT